LLLSLLWNFVFSIYFFSFPLSGFNTAPGLDGLSVEFYRKFWNNLKKLATKVFNFNYERGHLSNSHKIGAISFSFILKIAFVHSSIVISPSHFSLSLLLSLLWNFVFSIYFFSFPLSGFNTAPGLDGLSVEFYRKFWNNLKKLVTKVFNFNYERGHLSKKQKIGAISLIFKKKSIISG
jgi:hypothetical protein